MTAKGAAFSSPITNTFRSGAAAASSLTTQTHRNIGKDLSRTINNNGCRSEGNRQTDRQTDRQTQTAI